MKILTYKHGGETAVGVLKNDGSEVVPVNYLGCSAIDMNTFLDVQNEKKLEKLDRNISYYIKTRIFYYNDK